MKYFCGIDVGGSKILCTINNEKAVVTGKGKVKTEPDGKPESLINKISTSYDQALKDAGLSHQDIEAIGVAVPSAVNVEKGILLHAPNLKSLKNINIAELLLDKFNKPLFIDNDVNMGAYGEFCLGSASTHKNIYAIFLGTGIGGTYIKDGQLVRGKNFTAGEIGHMVVKIGGPKCGCGQKGCLEAIAGKIGIINSIKKYEEKNSKKSLINEYKSDWQKGIGSVILKKCYKKNDKFVVRAIDKAARAVGIACANLINLLGVDAIIIGGGLFEELKSDLIPIIVKYMIKHSICDGANGVEILEAKLGDYAVTSGAAWFVSRPENKERLFYSK